MDQKKLILVALIVIGTAGFLISYRGFGGSSINSFEECAAAGYPIMESYPEQCRTAEGRNFVRDISNDGGNGRGACPADAMLCPDGFAVGRTGPNCEFAACPSVGEFFGSIYGTVFLGPTCPVMREPPDPDCADRLYQTSLVVTTIDGARVIKQFNSNETGAFNTEVPPGEYVIRSAVAANILPYCQSDTFTVTANDSTEVVVSCDTGIR